MEEDTDEEEGDKDNAMEAETNEPRNTETALLDSDFLSQTNVKFTGLAL